MSTIVDTLLELQRRLAFKKSPEAFNDSAERFRASLARADYEGTAIETYKHGRYKLTIQVEVDG